MPGYHERGPAAQPRAWLLPIATVAFCLVWAYGCTTREVPGEKRPVPDPVTGECEGLFPPGSFPTASECATCHRAIYDEWRLSSHAYASISPVFHKFEQRINDLSQGTVGTFCVRCHASIGTAMGEPREMPLWDRSPISREGVTCITCHRVSEEYGKVNGERRIIPGALFDPMYGPLGGGGVAEVVGDAGEWKVKTEPGGAGMAIHREGILFDQLSKSEFCVACHQVAVHPGIKLEVVWDQYRASPAASEGITCQDCHMSKSPGVATGFETAPAAVIGGKPFRPDQKHSNHSFAGPGYPIAHPGVFPHNAKADRFTIQQWLTFDCRAGWGTDEFEDKVDSGQVQVAFPEAWSDVTDRVDAREIVEDNVKLLEKKRELRRLVMENGSRLDGPVLDGTPAVGKSLSFTYEIHNLNNGHNLPSGSLGAQPEIWLNVALIDPDGKNVWESGYVDSAGDMCDLHSQDVLDGRIPHDDQLVNLQTKFLITNVKGTDREWYLPVNMDIDQLPFIRPAGVPTTVLNHPPFIRMEGRSIPPLGVREAEYRVPGDRVTKPGTYKLLARLRSRAEPIYFMRFIGATREMEQAMNEWMIDIHPTATEIEVQ